MMNFLSELNTEQLKAVNLIDGVVICFAGAGSGKTRTLTYRIVNMMNKGINPENILAITFTKKATDEMKLRLLKLIDEKSNKLTISTIHSLSSKILRKEIDCLGYKNDFSIIDEDESIKIIKTILKNNSLEINISPKNLFQKISKYKSLEIYPVDELEIKIFNTYNLTLFNLNLLDYEDLLIKTIEIFNRFPLILEKYQNIYKYILVDEFQDTNNIQYTLIKMLSKKYCNLFLVGDDNQSIYGFRGSSDNISKLKIDYSNYYEIELNQNYRSSKKIIEVANKCISFNGKKRNLYSEINGSNHDVVYCNFRDEFEESKFIVNEIKALLDYEINYNQICILSRSNNIVTNLQFEFKKNKIPYTVLSNNDFFKKKVFKDLISFLSFVINPNDLISFDRIINLKTIILSDKVMDYIYDVCSLNVPLSRVIVELDNKISSDKYLKIINFYQSIRKLHSLVSSTSLSDLVSLIIREFDYLSIIDDNQLNDLEYMKEFVNELELKRKNKSVNELIMLFDDLSLTNFEISLSKNNGILFSTIHSAKGLEFDYVFMIGLNEGIFPNDKKIESENELLEERRIFYVGLTRAKKKLYLCSCSKRKIYGNVFNLKRSRFIEEILC